MNYKKNIILPVIVGLLFTNLAFAAFPGPLPPSQNEPAMTDADKIKFSQMTGLTMDEVDKVIQAQDLIKAGKETQANKILASLKSPGAKKFLASLEMARVKGVDAAIKANIASTQSWGQTYYDKHNSFKGVCNDILYLTGPGSPVSKSDSAQGLKSFLIRAAKLLGGSTNPTIGKGTFVYSSSNINKGAIVCHDSDKGWAAIVSLKGPSTPKSGYCVDSAGASKEVKKLSANSIICGK